MEIIITIFVVFGLIWIISLVAKFQQNVQQQAQNRGGTPPFRPNAEPDRRIRERPLNPANPQAQSQDDIVRFRQEIERLQRKKTPPKPRSTSEPTKPVVRVATPPILPPVTTSSPSPPPPPPPPPLPQSFTTLSPSSPPLPISSPPDLKPAEPPPPPARPSSPGRAKKVPATAVATLLKQVLQSPAGPGTAVILAEILGEPKSKRKS